MSGGGTRNSIFRALAETQPKSVDVSSWSIADTAPSALQDLAVEQIPNFTIAQVQALAPAQLAALSPLQIGAFVSSQMRALTRPQVECFSREQLRGLTPGQISAMTPEQIGAIESIDALSGSQVRALTLEHLSGLSAAQARALQPGQLRAMSSEQLDAVGVDRLTDVQREAISEEQRVALNLPPKATSKATVHQIRPAVSAHTDEGRTERITIYATPAEKDEIEDIAQADRVARRAAGERRVKVYSESVVARRLLRFGIEQMRKLGMTRLP